MTYVSPGSTSNCSSSRALRYLPRIFVSASIRGSSRPWRKRASRRLLPISNTSPDCSGVPRRSVIPGRALAPRTRRAQAPPSRPASSATVREDPRDRRRTPGFRSVPSVRRCSSRAARPKKTATTPKIERHRNGDDGIDEPDLVVALGEVRGAPERGERQQRRDHGPDGLRVRHGALYCLTYGRPAAAGPRERPMTPTRATSVSTYGSVERRFAEARSAGQERRALQTQGERAREAEQEAGAVRAERAPVAEDDGRQGDVAAAGRHVLVEGVPEAEREVGAAERRRGRPRGSRPRSGS